MLWCLWCLQMVKSRLRAAAPEALVVEHFLGPQQLADIYRATLLNVHPCSYDAYGMTVVEAASQVGGWVVGGGRGGGAAGGSRGPAAGTAPHYCTPAGLGVPADLPCRVLLALPRACQQQCLTSAALACRARLHWCKAAVLLGPRTC